MSRLKRVQGFSVHVPTPFRCFVRCSRHKEHNRPVTVLPALSYTGTCHGKSSFHEAQYPSLCLLAEVADVALSEVERGRFLPAIRAKERTKQEPKSVHVASQTNLDSSVCVRRRFRFVAFAFKKRSHSVSFASSRSCSLRLQFHFVVFALRCIAFRGVCVAFALCSFPWHLHCVCIQETLA